MTNFSEISTLIENHGRSPIVCVFSNSYIEFPKKLKRKIFISVLGITDIPDSEFKVVVIGVKKLQQISNEDGIPEWEKVKDSGIEEFTFQK